MSYSNILDKNILPILESIKKISDKKENSGLWNYWDVNDMEIQEDLSEDIDIIRFSLERMEFLELIKKRLCVRKNF